MLRPSEQAFHRTISWLPLYNAKFDQFTQQMGCRTQKYRTQSAILSIAYRTPTAISRRRDKSALQKKKLPPFTIKGQGLLCVLTYTIQAQFNWQSKRPNSSRIFKGLKFVLTTRTSLACKTKLHKLRSYPTSANSEKSKVLYHTLQRRSIYTTSRDARALEPWPNLVHN